MTQRPKSGRDTLRREAEKRLTDSCQAPESDSESPRYAALVHELRVHQVELEMQNENLREVAAALHASLYRYVNLFQFAPIGYVTLTQAGRIKTANRAGVALLGLAGTGTDPFERFIRPDEHPAWRQFLGHQLTPGQQVVFDLGMRTAKGMDFDAEVSAMQMPGEDGAPEVWIMVTDITERRARERAWRKIDERLGRLTPREREVCSLALSGMSNGEIAIRLKISRRAVENHRSRIHTKTESQSLLELSKQMTEAGPRPDTGTGRMEDG